MSTLKKVKQNKQQLELPDGSTKTTLDKNFQPIHAMES